MSYGFWKQVKCNKCSVEIEDFDYNWNGGLCDDCHRKRGLKIGLITFLVVLLISIPLSFIQFQYDLDKCQNLKSSESAYDFNQKIEINAQYNEGCYFLNNHPLAFPYYLILPIFIATLIGIVGFAYGAMTKPLNFRRVSE